MPLFGSRQEANLRATAKMVEEVIAELGLAPENNRLEAESANPAWGLMKGSAQVFIFVNSGPDDDFNTIQVTSPVLVLPPSGPNQTALLRHLLELNAGGLTGVAFGIKGDTVILVADRSTEDLDRSEVKDLILRIGYYADMYDDVLVSQFGGRRHSD